MEQLQTAKTALADLVTKCNTMSLEEWRNLVKNNIWTISIATTAGFLTWKLVKSRSKKQYNLPPGPKGWPVLGDTRLFKYTDFTEYVDLIKAEHGDIVTVNGAFGYNMILLTNYKNIKEIYLTRGWAFAHRPYSSFTSMVDFNDEISNAPVDEEWKVNKKFAVNALRQAQNKNGTFEDKILAELQVLFQEIRKTEGQVIETDKIFIKTTTNIITCILFNERYDYDDPILTGMVRDVKELFKGFMDLGMSVEFMPTWIFRLIYSGHVKSLKAGLDAFVTRITEKIEEHKKTYDPDHLRDFIDMYIQRNLGKENVDWKKTANTIIAAYPDAMETAGWTLAFVTFYLAYFPDIQRRLQDEIDSKTGQSHEVTASNKPDTILTQAFVYECLRHGIPFGGTAMHVAKEDTEVLGYTIPAGYPFMACLKNAVNDPTIFPEPEQFKIEHFLSPEGTLVNTEKMLAFGLGPRSCLGEQIVKSELYLFTANFIKNFSVSFPESEEKPSLKPVYGIPFTPSTTKVVIKSR